MRIQDSGINIIGYFKGGFGLAESARLVAESFKKNNYPYCLFTTDYLAPQHSQIDYLDPIENQFKYPINLFCIGQQEITAFIEEKHWKNVKSKYNIALWFWETNVIPLSHRACLEYLDEIWVTSKYLQEHLSSQTKIPVFHFPQPIKTHQLPNIPKKESNNLEKKFIFLFCFDFFGIAERKNPLAVIQAFHKAFEGNQNVQLVIKSQNGTKSKDQFDRLKSQIPNTKNIIWIDQNFNLEQQQKLMNSCDCYVSLHRSEGFGLTMAEAMLLEKPIIATNYSGNLDFMNSENSYLCDYDLQSIGKGFHPYPENGIWANAKIAHASELMRKVYNNYNEAKTKASRGTAALLATHSCEVVGKKMVERLTRISLPSHGRKMPTRLFKRKVKKGIKSILKPILKPLLSKIKK